MSEHAAPPSRRGDVVAREPFPAAAARKLADGQLRANLRRATHTIRDKRLRVVSEVSDWAQLREAIEAGADIVMLDNQTPEEAAKLVEMAHSLNPAVLIEASGNMSLETVRSYAEAGVDLISVGKITHSARAVDISFKIQTIQGL